MVLLGYHSTGGYKLLNPATNQVVISRDVLVDESKNWNWETAVSEASRNSILLNSDDPESRNSDESESELQGNGEEGNVRRSSRTRQLPQRLSSYELASDNAVNSEGDLVHFALLAEVEPVTVEEALESPKWIEAMEDELNSIEKNNTWELVSLPSGKKSIGVKWVYKVKVNPIGEIIKYKARLVVRGFLQKHGVDYDEVFAPVARLETVRTVVAYASVKNWSMHQLDVKSAFLNGDLEEEVYVDQPPGFARKNSEGKVFKLRKALYGLKQAPRAWNKKIDGSLQKMGFTKCVSEHGVYVKTDKNDSVVIVCLYVDDLLVTGNEEGKITEFKQQMLREFDMTDLGHLSYFLGIEFRKTKGGMVMCQEKYARDLLDRVGMLSCNPAETPAEAGICLMREGSEESVDSTYFRQIVGGLRYLCNTRPDLAYSVGLISRFMDKPRVPHLMAAKRILRYVKGTIEFGLLYPNEFDESDLVLSGYTDADWCGDKNDRKSTAGYVFMVGNSPVSWQSKKETVVALSSCEAEYIAASMSACQAVWLDTLMQELKMKQADPVELFIDNKSAINLAKYPVAHGRCKHIETRFHYLRDQVSSGKMKLTYCKTEQQVADVFTKALRGDNFKKLKKMLNVINTRELA